MGSNNGIGTLWTQQKSRLKSKDKRYKYKRKQWHCGNNNLLCSSGTTAVVFIRAPGTSRTPGATTVEDKGGSQYT